MNKYCGRLAEVTPIEHLKQGQGWTIDTIRIGGQTLRKVKVDVDVANLLRPDEKGDVCLYINWVLFTPNLLGMKYMATGEKHLINFAFVRGSFIRYAIIAALVFAIGGALIGGFLGNVAVSVLGIESLTRTPTAGIGFVGGIALAWWYALRVFLDWMKARRD